MDNGIKAEGNLTRFLFPFQYYFKKDYGARTITNFFTYNDYEIFSENLKRNIKWKSVKWSNSSYIYPYVEDFFDGKDKFVQKFELDKNAFSFPNNLIYLTKNKEQYNVFLIRFKEISLYSFKSGIGILAIDVELQELSDKYITNILELKENKTINHFQKVTFEEIILFNKSFHRLTEKDCILVPEKHFITEKEIEKKYVDVISPKYKTKKAFISSAEFIQQIISDFASNNLSIISYSKLHLLAYNYVFVNASKGDNSCDFSEAELFNLFKKDFYHLRNFNDRLYLPTSSDLKLNNKNIYVPHRNIFWGFSNFGGSVVVFKNKSSFINNQFKSRIFSEYFKIYLLALHQNLLLSKTGQVISDFIPLIADYNKKKNLPEILNGINTIRNDFLNNRTICWFPAVSNNFMYNEVYNHWRNVFEVEKMFDDISVKINELDEFLDRYYQRTLQKSTRLVEIVGFILVIVSILTGFWGMNFREITGGNDISFLEPTIWGISLIIIILILTISFFIKRKVIK